MRILFFLFFVTSFFSLQAQKKILDSNNKGLNGIKVSRQDSTKSFKKNIKNKKAKIQDYLIISHLNDTTYVDTTLSIIKENKFNYLRKDNFGIMPFSNIGQSYNTLSYNFKSAGLMPNFGARARHFNYMEIEDINYYHVPTPLTEILYKSAFEQGQLLDAFFTVNTSPQLNFSIAYKGLRSIGKYQQIVTSTGNFRFTTSYKTKNKRYIANAHVVMQDLSNEENGGLTVESIQNFESGNQDFRDRGVLEVNFENADNILEGKRFHLDHQYNVIKKNDSISKSNLNIKHIISLEDKYYQFNQTTASTTFFGDSFKSSSLEDKATLENLYNQLQLNYSNRTLGSLQINASHNNYNYGYDKLIILNNSIITNRLKGDVFSIGAKYHKTIKDFQINAEAGLNLSGDFEGNFIKAQLNYHINENNEIDVYLKHNSKAPNYNYQLYQSDYINYNWQNNFKNEEIVQFEINLISKNLAKLNISYTTINNYTYFKKDATSGFVRPFQNDKSISHLKVKLEKEIKYGKFALNNTIEYQNVQDENLVLNSPKIITRNTLYYSNHFFKKKALFLQTGITFNYFTKYNTNAYDPLLAEFYVQNEQELGSFPRLDFFINAKIRQTRIYFKAEHFNSAWTGFKYYSAPNYPYRDFTIRFGLVWDFFL